MSDNIVYILNDKLGGIASLHANLLRHRSADSVDQEVIRLHNRSCFDTRLRESLGADREQTFLYTLPNENVYAVLKRLRNALPTGTGPLVCNDWLELAMLGVHDVPRTSIFLVHDEYYLDLAARHEPVIDVFVAHSQHFYGRLRSCLPTRHDSIIHLPYGVEIPREVRRPAFGPLRLVFVGRMTESKGIFDLPVIDRMLAEAGVPVQWTVIGDGPLRQELQQQWRETHVEYFAPAGNDEVRRLCAAGDVFVLPTRFEGFPVSLLEAMSVGLVPVISDIPSGVPEVVSEEIGYRPAIGDCEAFARAIIELNQNRQRLESMSAGCRHVVQERHNVITRAAAYHRLFAAWQDYRRPRRKHVHLAYGSRLDQPWMPNFLVRTIRSSTSKRKVAA